MKQRCLYTAVALAIALSGCAVRTHKVELHVPAHAPLPAGLSVVDGRLDKTVYMTLLALGGTEIGTFAPEPPIEDVLKRYISSATHSSGTGVNVSIEDLDLKNRVGFGTNDDQTCRIESRVEIDGKTHSPVRTLVRNTENRSPFVYTAAKVILDDCLKKHAIDIDRVVTKN